MAFERKTLQETITEVEAGIASRLPGADTRLRRSVVYVLARVVAGVVYGLDAFIAFVARQMLPDTAEGEYLERLARIWGINRKAAETARGLVVFEGLDGSVMPGGTTIQRADGIIYTSTEEGIITSGSVSVAVEAQHAGLDGNANPGTQISLVSPVEGFDLGGVVGSAGISGGTDEESDESLRTRLLQRWQEPPQGGSKSDWERWALEVPGVTRAWAFPNWMGPGTVGIMFTTDDAESPIPTEEMVERVREHLTNPEIKPITADVYVVAPTPLPIDIAIQGLVPSTDPVKRAIREELKDLERRESKPGGLVLVSHIREAISISAGEWDHVLVSPLENIQPETYELPLLGTVTFLD